jgi:hypothetical protein
MGVVMDCGHRLCALIGEGCSIATGRSRGCTPGLTAKEIRPEVLDEVRVLLGALGASSDSDAIRTSATRLAAIIRREAREDRNLLVHVRDEEPELASVLERLIVRSR